MKRSGLLAVSLSGLLALASSTLAETRVALVVGNAHYEPKALKNPANDARAMAGTLKKLGFDVELVLDAPLDKMLSASRRFLDRAKDADVRLFYYAGHAAQVRGDNYLAPIDSRIRYEDELKSRGLNVSDEIVKNLDKEGRINIVILDACRNNTYEVRERSQASGLAEMRGSPRGTLIAYATAPGGVADDAPDRPNSLYTQHLLTAMQIPGLRIEDVFKRVTTAVEAETRERPYLNTPQIPWYASNMPDTTQFCFLPGPGGKCGGASAPPILVAKAASGSSRARSDETPSVASPEDNPLSVELFYRLTDDADHLKPDQVDALRRNAERGDTYAMTVLGWYFQFLPEPHAFTQARPKAESWYRKAADRGYAPAEYLLGWAYATGYITGHNDPETARLYYELGERKNYAPSQRALGNLLERSDPARAFALYRKAADQGLASAMNDLAVMYLQGRGTTRDIASAERWARLSYERSQTEGSQHILGYMYWRQLIKPKDDMDRIRLTSFARLREAHGTFLYGVE